MCSNGTCVPVSVLVRPMQLTSESTTQNAAGIQVSSMQHTLGRDGGSSTQARPSIWSQAKPAAKYKTTTWSYLALRMQCYIVSVHLRTARTNILMALSLSLPSAISISYACHTSISSTCLISVQTNHSHGLSKDSPWNPFRKQASQTACMFN